MPASDRVITVRFTGSAVMRADGDVWSAPAELRLAFDGRCLESYVTVGGAPALRYASIAPDAVAAWRKIAQAVQDYDDALPSLALAVD
jgi:hypothetical protein